MGYKVAVVGSVRPNDKRFRFIDNLDLYKRTCFKMGLTLAELESVDQYIVCISNDHLRDQSAPSWEEGDKAILKYKLEETADYMTLLGFLIGAKESKKVSNKIQLFISPQMIEGNLSPIPGVIIPPFWERTFTSPDNGELFHMTQFKDYLEIILISGDSLRSEMLVEYLPSIADIIITIGGGKATNHLYYAALAHKVAFMPIPYLRGASLTYYCKDQGKRNIFKKAYGKIFSPLLPESLINEILKDPNNFDKDVAELDFPEEELWNKIKKVLKKALAKNINVLCLGTEWLSRKGGLSTFNRMLCTELAKLECDVTCYVPELGGNDFEHAQEAGVHLQIAPKLTGLEKINGLGYPVKPVDNFKPDIIIGHDRITGQYMTLLKEFFYRDAQTILFIHTSPGEIELYKPGSTMQKAEDRDQLQIELASKADWIVAVGNRLFKSIQTNINSLNKANQLLQFDPGLFKDIDQIDYTSNTPIYVVLLKGRVEDSVLKGVDIGIEAMEKVFKDWNIVDENGIEVEIQLHIRGVEPQDEQHFKKQIAGKKFIRLLPFTTDAKILDAELKTCSLFLMPSRVEGFGLVALEAISAGRPLLVNEKSGFGMLIKKIAPTEVHHWVLSTESEKDIDNWANKIRSILEDRLAAGHRLKKLVATIDEKESWGRSTEKLLNTVTKKFKQSQ